MPSVRTIIFATLITTALGLSLANAQDKARDNDPVTEYRITRASRTLDFVLHIREHPSNNTEGREGSGEVLVYRKGASKPLQKITMENIFVSLDKSGQPLVNANALYEEQGMINVADFNFNGHEDFAVHTGVSGSYGQSSYAVYLYSPGTGHFVYNEPLSSLIEESSAFFDVDKKNKQLITLSKSGCCHHETAKYAMRNDTLLPLTRVTEDVTNSGQVIITREVFVNGDWKEVKARHPQHSRQTKK